MVFAPTAEEQIEVQKEYARDTKNLATGKDDGGYRGFSSRGAYERAKKQSEREQTSGSDKFIEGTGVTKTSLSPLGAQYQLQQRDTGEGLRGMSKRLYELLSEEKTVPGKFGMYSLGTGAIPVFDSQGNIQGVRHPGLFGATVYTGNPMFNPLRKERPEKEKSTVEKVAEKAIASTPADSPLSDAMKAYYQRGVGAATSMDVGTPTGLQQFLLGASAPTPSPIGGEISQQQGLYTLPDGTVIDLKTGKIVKQPRMSGLDIFKPIQTYA